MLLVNKRRSYHLAIRHSVIHFGFSVNEGGRWMNFSFHIYGAKGAKNWASFYIYLFGKRFSKCWG